MKEVLIVGIVFFLYFFVSYLVYSRLVKSRKLVFVVISAAYLLFTYFLFLLVFRIGDYSLFHLFDAESEIFNGIIIATFFICTLTAFINIIAAMAKKVNKKKREQENKNHLPAI
jgi:hypothetical protein